MTDNTNIFSAQNSNIQIQQGTNNSSQSQINVATTDYSELLKGISQIQSEIGTLGLNDSQQNELRTLLDSVAEQAKQNEGSPKIKQGLALVKEFLMRTATTLAATGAVSLITSLASSL